MNAPRRPTTGGEMVSEGAVLGPLEGCGEVLVGGLTGGSVEEDGETLVGLAGGPTGELTGPVGGAGVDGETVVSGPMGVPEGVGPAGPDDWGGDEEQATASARPRWLRRHVGERAARHPRRRGLGGSTKSAESDISLQ